MAALAGVVGLGVGLLAIAIAGVLSGEFLLWVPLFFGAVCGVSGYVVAVFPRPLIRDLSPDADLAIAQELVELYEGPLGTPERSLPMLARLAERYGDTRVACGPGVAW